MIIIWLMACLVIRSKYQISVEFMMFGALIALSVDFINDTLNDIYRRIK